MVNVKGSTTGRIEDTMAAGQARATDKVVDVAPIAQTGPGSLNVPIGTAAGAVFRRRPPRRCRRETDWTRR